MSGATGGNLDPCAKATGLGEEGSGCLLEPRLTQFPEINIDHDFVVLRVLFT